ncbi:hypothetical protein AgCh_014209 [Apium graveolens]
MECNTLVLFSTILFLSFTNSSSVVDVLRTNQTIQDGETIVSANGQFELGFFSPGSGNNLYVGIWFKNISYGTIVWVANRDAPLNNTSGILRIDHKAISLFANATTNTVVWSSNTSRFVANPVAQLLDSGNLVFRDEKDDGIKNLAWQSFDYIGDTMLPGMKLGTNLVTGLQWYLSSWKTVNDPSPGSFVHRLDTHGYPQLTLWKGSELHARSGPWVGNRFSGSPEPRTNTIYSNEFFLEENEIYYSVQLFSKSSITRFKLTPNGILQRLIWNDQNKEWTIYLTLLASDCDQYGVCGPYGTCDISSSPRCSCLRGFNPKIPEKWEAADWKDGCVRTTPLDCGHGDGFIRHSGVKLPDTRQSWYNLSMNLKECKSICLKNCSCTAYSNIKVEKGGSGCLLWFQDLMDIKGFTEDGQDIYVRMSVSEFGQLHVNEHQNLELPLFEFRTIANSTSNFSHDKKIGEGGFGPVYKGLLEDGQQIAVKRLSENSRQGTKEFKNEVVLIAKLQHRNLVSLLGYCIEEEERILIYEYMPNKSLDSYIFDKENSRLADWPKLYKIINGVARGLLYLHQDSKLRIIHRDLKASNVLLDHDMNPKISDFGMARSFGGSQTEANTTSGYMPPEYVIDGTFSTKSDVYSFGVLVLELVSGKKNRCFEHADHNLNLLGHAWRCFNEEKLQDLIDGAILELSQYEVDRIVQIGLLCVQEYPEDRPNMSSVVMMLNSTIALPKPETPGFFTERRRHVKDNSQSNHTLPSADDFSFTAIEPR